MDHLCLVKGGVVGAVHLVAPVDVADDHKLAIIFTILEAPLEALVLVGGGVPSQDVPPVDVEGVRSAAGDVIGWDEDRVEVGPGGHYRVGEVVHSVVAVVAAERFGHQVDWIAGPPVEFGADQVEDLLRQVGPLVGAVAGAEDLQLGAGEAVFTDAFEFGAAGLKELWWSLKKKKEVRFWRSTTPNGRPRPSEEEGCS